MVESELSANKAILSVFIVNGHIPYTNDDFSL